MAETKKRKIGYKCGNAEMWMTRVQECAPRFLHMTCHTYREAVPDGHSEPQAVRAQVKHRMFQVEYQLETPSTERSPAQAVCSCVGSTTGTVSELLFHAELVYDKESNPTVTEPCKSSRTNCMPLRSKYEPRGSDLLATYRVGALSSKHDNQLFRIRLSVTVGKTTAECLTPPFSVVSKLVRKRSVLTEHGKLDVRGLSKNQLKNIITRATQQLDDTTNYVAIVGEDFHEKHAFVVWMRLHDKPESDDCSFFGQRLMQQARRLRHKDDHWTVKVLDHWPRSGILDYINDMETAADDLSLHHVIRNFRHRKIHHRELDMEEVIEAFTKYKSDLKPTTFATVLGLFGLDPAKVTPTRIATQETQRDMGKHKPKHERVGVIRVLFDKDRLWWRFHTSEYEEEKGRFTMDFHHIWKCYKQTLGSPKYNWKLEGERDELEDLLESMLGPFYQDNLIIRSVNDGDAQYE